MEEQQEVLDEHSEISLQKPKHEEKVEKSTTTNSRMHTIFNSNRLSELIQQKQHTKKDTNTNSSNNNRGTTNYENRSATTNNTVQRIESQRLQPKDHTTISCERATTSWDSSRKNQYKETNTKVSLTSSSPSSLPPPPPSLSVLNNSTSLTNRYYHPATTSSSSSSNPRKMENEKNPKKSAVLLNKETVKALHNLSKKYTTIPHPLLSSPPLPLSSKSCALSGSDHVIAPQPLTEYIESTSHTTTTPSPNPCTKSSNSVIINHSTELHKAEQEDVISYYNLFHPHTITNETPTCTHNEEQEQTSKSNRTNRDDRNTIVFMSNSHTTTNTISTETTSATTLHNNDDVQSTLTNTTSSDCSTSSSTESIVRHNNDNYCSPATRIEAMQCIPKKRGIYALLLLILCALTSSIYQLRDDGTNVMILATFYSKLTSYSTRLQYTTCFIQESIPFYWRIIYDSMSFYSSIPIMYTDQQEKGWKETSKENRMPLTGYGYTTSSIPFLTNPSSKQKLLPSKISTSFPYNNNNNNNAPRQQHHQSQSTSNSDNKYSQVQLRIREQIKKQFPIPNTHVPFQHILSSKQQSTASSTNKQSNPNENHNMNSDQMKKSTTTSKSKEMYFDYYEEDLDVSVPFVDVLMKFLKKKKN